LTKAVPSTATIFKTGAESVDNKKTSPNAPSPIWGLNVRIFKQFRKILATLSQNAAFK
jgi:hypothetical protein